MNTNPITPNIDYSIIADKTKESQQKAALFSCKETATMLADYLIGVKRQILKQIEMLKNLKTTDPLLIEAYSLLCLEIEKVNSSINPELISFIAQTALPSVHTMEQMKQFVNTLKELQNAK
jgi:hypothetical protein